MDSVRSMLRLMSVGVAGISRAARRVLGSARGKRATPSYVTATQKWKVLFCTEHFPTALDLTRRRFADDPDVDLVSCQARDVAKAIVDVDVAIPFMARLTSEVLKSANRLKLIIQYGVGLEGVDVQQASCQGIWVSNIRSSETHNARSCAEHAIYLMLALLRRQRYMQDAIKHRRLGFPMGEMLYGRHVLVIGFGGIALQLIPLLKAFGVRMTGTRRRPWSTISPLEREIAEMLNQKCEMDDLSTVLPEIDIVCMACVQDKENLGMINEVFLSHCKRGVLIVNVCRGGLLDEDAVIQRLKDGMIGGLGLDVQWVEPLDPDHPITQHPKCTNKHLAKRSLFISSVLLTPHVAGVTRSSYEEMAGIVAAEVQRIKKGQAPSRIINSHLLKPKQ